MDSFPCLECEKLRLQFGEALRALEIIANLGPVDPATNAAKIGIDAVGVAVVALNKMRERRM